MIEDLPCSWEKEYNAAAKDIAPCQLVQSTQADMSQNFLLFLRPHVDISGARSFCLVCLSVRNFKTEW